MTFCQTLFGMWFLCTAGYSLARHDDGYALQCYEYQVNAHTASVVIVTATDAVIISDRDYKPGNCKVRLCGKRNQIQIECQSTTQGQTRESRVSTANTTLHSLPLHTTLLITLIIN
jgi:hypothetical protein